MQNVGWDTKAEPPSPPERGAELRAVVRGTDRLQATAEQLSPDCPWSSSVWVTPLSISYTLGHNIHLVILFIKKLPLLCLPITFWIRSFIAAEHYLSDCMIEVSCQES